MLPNDVIALLRCPLDGQPLLQTEDGKWLITQDGTRRYPIENGIAHLLAEYAQNLQADNHG